MANRLGEAEFLHRVVLNWNLKSEVTSVTETQWPQLLAPGLLSVFIRLPSFWGIRIPSLV